MSVGTSYKQEKKRIVLEVDSLLKEFSIPSGTEVAVDNVSLEIRENEFFTLVGPSGCGKTTTLRCIAGLESPTKGEIISEGKPITKIPPNKRNIAMMFQDIALYPHMTIEENISYPLKVNKVSVEDRTSETRNAAEIMQIPETLDKYPGDLSGGQRQRAALARTVVQDPELFLLDEPLSDLDAKLKVDIRKEIQNVHEHLGKPTIYVTHDQEEAMTMSDRIGVMNKGEIEQIGTPLEIYQYPANEFVAQFIGNPSMNFFDAEVSSIEEDSVNINISGEEFTLDIDKGVDLPKGTTNLRIGIRPEHFTIDSNHPDLRCNIDLVEPLGDRVLIYLTLEGKEIRALLPSDTKTGGKETLALSAQDNSIYIFNEESKDFISKGHLRRRK